MSAGAPWSVKGIDPKAREVAKDLARRSGMTLGEWLNRVILEDDVPEDVTSEDHFLDRSQRPFTEAARPRLVSVAPLSRTDDMARIAYALDRLTDRIEASETRTGLAISGVEHSVRQAVARIETTEREHVAVASRLETEQTSMADRLRRMEADVAGPRSIEALRLLEQRVQRVEAVHGDDPALLIDEVVSRLGLRLADAESRTADALESLRASLATLDGRLKNVEGGAPDQRFESLAASLTQRVEDARAKIVATLSDSSAGRVDERFAELAAQVKAAETRSADAIQTMGRDVLNMAEAVNRRLLSSEQTSAEAIEKVGGEMARVAGAVENRLGRAELVQAEALGKLSDEIQRITERLSERMLVSERRAAEAIDNVGDQVSRVTERMEQRHERASDELAEHIRQSEERTSRLLDEVRVRLEPQATAAAPRPIEDVPAAPSPAVFGPALFSRAEIEDDIAEAASSPFEVGGFAPIPEPAEDLFDLDQPAPPRAADEDDRPLSTREVIEQARAAARAAAGAQAVESSEAPIEVRAKARWRTTGRNKPGIFAMAKARSAPNSTLQTALMVAGGAAFLAVGSAGVVLMEGPPALPASVQSLALGSIHGSPRAAIALAPQALGAVTPIPTEAAHAAPVKPATPPDALVDAYVSAVKGVEAGTPGALGRLKAIADAGHAPAQAYLGKLYETGDHGVAKSMSEARRWTELAAQGGDPAAMHNLALYAFRGEGGPQDLVSAVRWFRKAADQGVVDSQYNLGLLYQTGSGAPRDLAEAYKWFSIAANGGDGQARANAIDLEPKLTKAQLAQAEQGVDAYRPGGARSVVAASAGPNAALAAAQRILGRLGYYQGPTDGAATPKTRTAMAAYQRDQGLAATGALDQNTAARLAVFNR
jgi:localization factor PodJL